jgi:hypothetical protein
MLALSCGGSPPPLQAPAVQGDGGRASRAALTPPNLSAVNDPPGLIVAGRISKLNASLSTIRGWSKVSLPAADEVAALLAGEAMRSLVDLDQPIDFAVSVSGVGLRMRNWIAVSLALKDVERAKASLSERYKLIPTDNGSLLLDDGRAARPNEDEDDGAREEDDTEPGTQHSDRGENEHRPCELAPAYGAATTRLVCAWSAKALSELGPWLTRTATRLAANSDVHVEMRMDPLRGTISAQKRLLGSILAGTLVGDRVEQSAARQLVASVVADAVDFSLDLDRALLDVQLSERAATATLSLRFMHMTSALARIATAHPERSGPAPAVFWQLPGDADFAAFERGIDESELARGRELVLHAADEALADEGVKDADRKSILEAAGNLASSAPAAYASGLDVDAAKKALAAEKPLADLVADAAAFGEAERASAMALLGWRVMTWDEPATKWVAALKDLAAALRRPSVSAAFRASGRGIAPPSLNVAPMPKGVALPSSAQHYVLEFYPFQFPVRSAAGSGVSKPKPLVPPTKPVDIHLVLVPDGARTWLGVGTIDAVASKLAVAMAGAGDKLGGRNNLSPLKASSLGAAGFFTLRGWPEGAWPVSPIYRGKLLNEVAQLPRAGAVPIAFSVTSNSAASPAQVTATLDMPRGAIEDIATEINLHGL